MQTPAFAPWIDIPLLAIALVAFVWHFNHWAFLRNRETNANLPGRLPAARWRVIFLSVGILVLCWTINLAVWSILALLLGVGLVVALVSGGEIYGGAFGIFAAAYLTREWAFGFPHFILDPPRQSIPLSVHQESESALIGKTGVITAPLRPTGEAQIDGMKYSVVSFDGGWIDAGTKVEVKARRHGIYCVTPLCSLSPPGGE